MLATLHLIRRRKNQAQELKVQREMTDESPAYWDMNLHMFHRDRILNDSKWLCDTKLSSCMTQVHRKNLDHRDVLH